MAFPISSTLCLPNYLLRDRNLWTTIHLLVSKGLKFIISTPPTVFSNDLSPESCHNEMLIDLQLIFIDEKVMPTLLNSVFFLPLNLQYYQLSVLKDRICTLMDGC
ncbi:hypothetical protein Bca52824_001999 [Brassica carinata]|uniref:Uncharacterized protein n=1 Tax=Brassica carinata TaxID=52824 RepID=A0A8X8BA70_BRACI|nr:hypothetical protein Bca52824_001999 [Brassica carinata]